MPRNLSAEARTQITLNAKQMFALTNLMQAEYVASKKTDPEFKAAQLAGKGADLSGLQFHLGG